MNECIYLLFLFGEMVFSMMTVFEYIFFSPFYLLDMAAPPILPPTANLSASVAANLEAQFEDPDEPKKKKYAKEAWPGKKPVPSLLV